MTDRYWINFAGSMLALGVGVWLGIRSWNRADS